MVIDNAIAMKLGSPLVNLALLETLKSDKIQDEIDLFLPFIAVTIREIDKPIIESVDVQVKLSELFGFRPPISAIKVLMSRAKRRGLLVRENSAFIPIHEKVREWSNGYEGKKEDLNISLDSLKGALVQFTLDRFKKALHLSEAEQLIFRFIEENVSAVISKRAYNRAELNESIKNTDHIIASFISHIHRKEPVLLDHFGRCVKGMLLANYLFFADKINSKKTFEKMSVYLDSPLVIGLMGFNGAQNKQANQEFIDLLKSLQIQVYIFDRTLDEIERLLSAWKSDIGRKFYGRFNTKTLELLRSQGFDEARLDTEIKKLSRTIEGLGIIIKYGFSAKERYQCNEKELEAAIAKNFKKNKNLEHDTICISRVHNSREGRFIKSLSESYSVFVTGNTGLAKFANGYFSKIEYRSSIPVVVSEQWMTIMFWLKRPDIAGRLPTDQIVATAYSLLYTDDKFWDSFISRMEAIQKRGLLSEEDFVVVRWDSDLLRLVHDVSVDVGEDFSEDDVFEIVEAIKAKNEEESKALISEIQTASELALQKEREQSQQILEAERSTNRLLSDRNAALERNVSKFAGYVSNLISGTFCLFVACCFVIATIQGLPPTTIPEEWKLSFIPTAFPRIVLLVTAIWGVASWFFGLDVLKMHKKLKKWLTSKILSFFTT
ncbi:hypothetical protein [Pseudomonas alkylphenolica]|uniref:hypothetical protein n=1 Tax=Pseudomonas alkylphenolica TaxID=237609 RepID=UPI0018D7C1D8|nr:hypothetical protein [Pseudomonas alkylphenolica]MBH3426860.1 hypothetical protein [Pseudomonas alkylphenolica]